MIIAGPLSNFVRIWFWWLLIALFTGMLVFGYAWPARGSSSNRYCQDLPVSFAISGEERIVGGYLVAKNKKKWHDLTPREKEQMRKRYKEWQSLPPKEKEIIRRRMEQLEKMSPEERVFFKQLFKKWQHLAPGDRHKIERKLQNWEHLTPDEQEAIRRRFRK